MTDDWEMAIGARATMASLEMDRDFAVKMTPVRWPKSSITRA